MMFFMSKIYLILKHFLSKFSLREGEGLHEIQISQIAV